MTDSQFRLIPMKKTQSIPVHWEFSQDDYDKLVKGHWSKWSVFLRDDIVHVCTIPGKEFYRFAITKTDGCYATDAIEAYVPDNFYESARLHGWNENKIERHQRELKELAVEEIVGFLASYFDISVA